LLALDERSAVAARRSSLHLGSSTKHALNSNPAQRFEQCDNILLLPPLRNFVPRCSDAAWRRLAELKNVRYTVSISAGEQDAPSKSLAPLLTTILIAISSLVAATAVMILAIDANRAMNLTTDFIVSVDEFVCEARFS
jgi:hypothetical protein